MITKIIAAGVAGGMLVAAGLATSIISRPSVAVAEDGDDEPGQTGLIPRTLSFLSEVLSDLVDEGTIDQGQADAILQAAEEKAATVKADFEERAELLRSLLEDGVITSDEKGMLPDDSPFLSDRYDDAWDDGELTVDELAPSPFHGRRGPGFTWGFGLGTLLDDGGIDQEEYDSLIGRLPDSSPFASFDASDYLADGVITPDELREIFRLQWSSGQWDFPSKEEGNDNTST